jgi:hypothetical protein
MDFLVLALIALAFAVLAVLSAEEGADSRPGPRDLGHDWT